MTRTAGSAALADEVKARIVADTLGAGVRVSDVARRHGCNRSRWTAWRRLARQGKLVIPADGEVESRR